MKTTEIEVSINYTKEWRIKHTDECVQYDSEHKHFYHFQGAGKCVLDFPESNAPEYLQLCDEAVSNNCHSLPVANIHNTSFLSMVLTQFLHKAPSIHNDETHN